MLLHAWQGFLQLTQSQLFLLTLYGLWATGLCVLLLWENGRLCRKYAELARARKELEEVSLADGLTGLQNRSALVRWFEKSRSEVGGFAVVIDVNNFKTINDTIGHEAGDRVLAGVGKLIGNSIREGDFACRYGGDEFVIVFRAGSADIPRERMHEIEHRLKAFQLRHDGKRFPVTISWGMAPIQNGRLFQALQEADALMYRHKSWKKLVRAAG